jgi:large subunit ribosomal protein L24
MKSIKPRKQRKEFYNAPLHKKRKWIAAHLEENLLLKYDKRSIPIVEGDTVKVMRGSFKGHEDKIVNVNVKKWNVEIEGLTMAKADGNKIAKPIHPSNVLITKLNLTDKWRRRKLERDLSEETKKEIEKEAEIQIKEAEEEKRVEAEEKALSESEVETSEESDEKELVEKSKPKEEKEKTTPKDTSKKPPKKKEIKKEPKKNETPPKKKPTEKTSIKEKTPKKEEGSK